MRAALAIVATELSVHAAPQHQCSKLGSRVLSRLC
jgi:hypothetical protein